MVGKEGRGYVCMRKTSHGSLVEFEWLVTETDTLVVLFFLVEKIDG